MPDPLDAKKITPPRYDDVWREDMETLNSEDCQLDLPDEAVVNNIGRYRDASRHNPKEGQKVHAYGKIKTKHFWTRGTRDAVFESGQYIMDDGQVMEEVTRWRPV